MTFTRIASLVGVAAASAILVAGCGSDGTPSADSSTTPAASSPSTSSSSSSTCVGGSGEYFTANTESGEPEIGLPKVDGWNRASQFESGLVRLAIADPSLTVDGFTANVVVTVEKAPASGEAEFERQLRGLESTAVKGSVSRQSASTTCGYPSLVVDYRMNTPTQNQVVTTVTSLIVTVPGEPSSTTMSVTIQTADPDDASYREAKQTILDGVQITVAGASNRS